MSGATLETTFHSYTGDFREFKMRWLRVLGTRIITGLSLSVIKLFFHSFLLTECIKSRDI